MRRRGPPTRLASLHTPDTGRIGAQARFRRAPGAPKRLGERTATDPSRVITALGGASRAHVARIAIEHELQRRRGCGPPRPVGCGERLGTGSRRRRRARRAGVLLVGASPLLRGTGMTVSAVMPTAWRLRRPRSTHAAAGRRRARRPCRGCVTPTRRGSLRTVTSDARGTVGPFARRHPWRARRGRSAGCRRPRPWAGWRVPGRG